MMSKIQCEKHIGRTVMHAFSYGKCNQCGKEVTTPHIPCDVICEDCSEKKGLCVVCGCKI